MSKYSRKEWFAIFLGTLALGVVRGVKDKEAAKKKYPGAVARPYASLAAVVNGVIHDTQDCGSGSGGRRCFYGYYIKGDGAKD